MQHPSDFNPLSLELDENHLFLPGNIYMIQYTFWYLDFSIFGFVVLTRGQYLGEGTVSRGASYWTIKTKRWLRKNALFVPPLKNE